MMSYPRSDYKLSKYMVASEPVTKQAYRMVFSTRTAESYLLRDSIYQDLLSGRFDAIDEVMFARLTAAKLLTLGIEDELATVISENKKTIASSKVLYTAIAPSADCQLGCDYCGQSHTKNKMNGDTHDKILARLEKKLLKQPAYNHVNIGWFGAEPLMGLKSIYVLSARMEALALAHGCAYSAAIVTNGLALTKDVYYRLAGECHVKKFEITLDGAEKYHDARRHTKKGHASFALIMANLEQIINDPRYDPDKAYVSIRCNVDARNHTGTTELIDMLEAKGILGKVSFYTAAVHSWGNAAHLGALSQRSYADFELDVLAKLIGKTRNVGLLPTKANSIVCMSLQNDAELIDTFGDIYNCSEISQVAAYKEVTIYKIDELKNQGPPLLAERPFANWNDDIASGKVPCHDCRILPVCGGACPKLWNEGISPCPPIKENIEKRLILQMLNLKHRGLLAA